MLQVRHNIHDEGIKYSCFYCFEIGDIFLADILNNRIRKITASTGIIITIAGSSTNTGFSGDNGAATAATFNNPYGVAVDALDNVYVPDTMNNRLRKLTFLTSTPSVAPTIFPR